MRNQSTTEWAKYQDFVDGKWPTGVRMPTMARLTCALPVGPVLAVEIVDGEPLPHSPADLNCTCRGNWAGCYLSALRKIPIHEVLDCRVVDGNLMVLDAA